MPVTHYRHLKIMSFPLWVTSTLTKISTLRLPPHSSPHSALLSILSIRNSLFSTICLTPFSATLSPLTRPSGIRSWCCGHTRCLVQALQPPSSLGEWESAVYLIKEMECRGIKIRYWEESLAGTSPIPDYSSPSSPLSIYFIYFIHPIASPHYWHTKHTTRSIGYLSSSGLRDIPGERRGLEDFYEILPECSWYRWVAEILYQDEM